MTEEKPKKEETEKKEPSSTKDTEDKKKEVKVPEKFKKLVDEIEKMPVSDLAELVKILEEKFGIEAQTQMAFAPMPGAAGAQGAGEGAEEKSSYNVELTGIGDKKIEVIKIIRDITDKGLKESKDLVDAAEKEPQTIRENVKKEEAEEMKKKFEAAGAKVELK